MNPKDEGAAMSAEEWTPLVGEVTKAELAAWDDWNEKIRKHAPDLFVRVRAVTLHPHLGPFDDFIAGYRSAPPAEDARQVAVAMNREMHDRLARLTAQRDALVAALEADEDLRSIGQQMSNVLYKYKQESRFGELERDGLDRLQRQWDAVYLRSKAALAAARGEAEGAR